MDTHVNSNTEQNGHKHFAWQERGEPVVVLIVLQASEAFEAVAQRWDADANEFLFAAADATNLVLTHMRESSRFAQ